MRRGVPLEAVVAFVEEVEASKREDFTEEWQCICSYARQCPQDPTHKDSGSFSPNTVCTLT
ncbi:hypothetical protein FOC1_g10010469 [Fusarium oxysporum f. sp. cubense race 1]|nr:hypothetical protein FOC1_g10010469 [Fusarium oxysporum f. sp. cubense race 1]